MGICILRRIRFGGRRGIIPGQIGGLGRLGCLGFGCRGVGGRCCCGRSRGSEVMSRKNGECRSPPAWAVRFKTAVHSLRIGCAGARYLSFHPPERLQTLEKIIQHRNFMRNQRDSPTPHVIVARTYPNLTQLKPSEYLQTNKQPLIPHPPRSPFYGLPHPPPPPLLHPKPSKLPKHTKPSSRTPTPFFRSLIIELLLDSLPYHSHTTHLEQCFMLESRLGLCEGVMRTVVIAKRCRLEGGWGGC